MRQKKWGYSGTLTKQISEREIRHREIARRLAAEGMVLLENNGVLPLEQNSKIAVYGGGAAYTIKGGTGSGAVNNRDNVSVIQGLRDAGFVITNEDWLKDYESRYEAAREAWIRYIYEISIPGDFMSLYSAHAANPLQMPQGDTITETDTQTAIYVISRVSGEGADRKAVKGDYYLSDTEEKELAAITKCYKKCIVLLNTGGIMDTGFIQKYGISAVLLMSQAGMEGGHAVADCLTGKVNPSGKLTDTWAVEYKDYPSSENFSHNNGNVYEEKYTEGIYVGYRYFDSFQVPVKYPFGYGLSYTKFRIEQLGAELIQEKLYAKVKVTNIGERAGKETVFLFASCPQGLLVKEKKRLIAFGKTELLQSGESEEICLETDLRLLESYHAGTSSYYMEKGMYYILMGTSAEDCRPLVKLKLMETVRIEELESICPLLDALKEIKPEEQQCARWEKEFADQFKEAECKTLELDAYLLKRSGEKESEQEILKEAVEIRKKLTLEEKAELCCGKQNGKNDEIVGNASGQVPGAAGETTGILRETYGVANIVMADGPAGIRISQCYRVNPDDGSVYRLSPYEGLQNRIFGTDFEKEGALKYYQFCTAIPIGTLLAQSFDLKLMKEAGKLIGREMEEFGLTLWLAPGMNIHRNPLCGRNFEYYSEDPLVSGRMAGAITEGVQSYRGIGTTIKHFACNNQEENRRGVSSIVSERALREIYLKGFEIAVREAQPLAIMTSYNKINGVHTANSRDLCTQVARREWGFNGIIMTDWTTTNADGGSSAAKCIAAGNDLVMPGNRNDINEIIDAVKRNKDQKLEEQELDACCDRILDMILKSNRYEEIIQS